MVAFAANSIFCRFALEKSLIDALSFSSIRITSGAVVLWIIFIFSARQSKPPFKSSLKMASMLVLYAVSFSLAYLSLSTGTGALILFGAVQTSMIISGFIAGERLSLKQWTGLFMAVTGLICLVFPGITAPSVSGALLMGLAGMAWGLYSLMGKKAGNPVAATAFNFIYAVPMVLLIQLLIHSPIHISLKGFIFAALSGSIASGAGYVIWYAALKHLSASRAAIIQLTVPVIAAVGGLIFLSENPSLRLILSGMIILSGVALAMVQKKQ